MWLVNLITYYETLPISGNIFQLTSIFMWMTQYVDLYFKATISLTQTVKIEGCPVIAANLSMHILPQNDQFRFLNTYSLKDLELFFREDGG